MTTTPVQQAVPAQPAIIARRGACEADGVGLSHYILVDHAAPTPAASAQPAATPTA